MGDDEDNEGDDGGFDFSAPPPDIGEVASAEDLLARNAEEAAPTPPPDDFSRRSTAGDAEDSGLKAAADNLKVLELLDKLSDLKLDEQRTLATELANMPGWETNVANALYAARSLELFDIEPAVLLRESILATTQNAKATVTRLSTEIGNANLALPALAYYLTPPSQRDEAFETARDQLYAEGGALRRNWKERAGLEEQVAKLIELAGKDGTNVIEATPDPHLLDQPTYKRVIELLDTAPESYEREQKLTGELLEELGKEGVAVRKRQEKMPKAIEIETGKAREEAKKLKEKSQALGLANETVGKYLQCLDAIDREETEVKNAIASASATTPGVTNMGKLSDRLTTLLGEQTKYESAATPGTPLAEAKAAYEGFTQARSRLYGLKRQGAEVKQHATDINETIDALTLRISEEQTSLRQYLMTPNWHEEEEVRDVANEVIVRVTGSFLDEYLGATVRRTKAEAETPRKEAAAEYDARIRALASEKDTIEKHLAMAREELQLTKGQNASLAERVETLGKAFEDRKRVYAAAIEQVTRDYERAVTGLLNENDGLEQQNERLRKLAGLST